MTVEEYLLLCLAEECAEVTQRVSKALRFTATEIQPGHAETNAQRISGELNDLLGVFEMLVARGVLPEADERAIEEKMRKVEKYMAYSRERGTLE